jgi:hypothetical protein
MGVYRKPGTIAASFVMACGVLVTGCGGGEDETQVEQGPPLHWIKICRAGQFFCTLTTGDCSQTDDSCKACDAGKPLSQC